MIYALPDPRPDYSRFYLARPLPDQPPSELRIARLIGCRVLLDRVGQEETKIGRFWIKDTYGHGSITFKALAVGPGEWVFKGKKGRRRQVWIEPCMAPGDICLSCHFWRASEHPTWHQPEYLDDAGGRGRVILDLRFIEAYWPDESKQQK